MNKLLITEVTAGVRLRCGSQLNHFRDGLLKQFVAAGLLKASSYGFNRLEECVVFVGFMFSYAPNFDQHPRIQSILSNLALSVEEKLKLLTHYDLKDVWEEVFDMADADAWFDEDGELPIVDVNDPYGFSEDKDWYLKLQHASVAETDDEFSFEDGFWRCTETMPTWQNLGGGGANNISLVAYFSSDSTLEKPVLTPLIKEHVRWIIQNEAPIFNSVASALIAAYPGMKSDAFLVDFEEEELEEMFPSDETPSNIIALFTLQDILVHDIQSDLPIFGITFDVPWEEEHGVGVLVRGKEILEICQSDTAVLRWVIEKHLVIGN